MRKTELHPGGQIITNLKYNFPFAQSFLDLDHVVKNIRYTCKPRNYFVVVVLKGTCCGYALKEKELAG